MPPMGKWAKLRMASYLVLAMIGGYAAALQFMTSSDALREDTWPSGITASTSPHALGAGQPEVIYHNCAEARAAGVTPIYEGQPGYAPWLDSDHDGIACEPYYGPVRNFGRKTHDRHRRRYSASP